MKGFAPGSGFVDGLSLRVEGAEALEVGEALGEERHQAPTHQQHLAHGTVAGVPDDRLVRGGRDVVAGQQVGHARLDLAGTHALGKLLLLPTAIVAATHAREFTPSTGFELLNTFPKEGRRHIQVEYVAIDKVRNHSLHAVDLRAWLRRREHDGVRVDQIITAFQESHAASVRNSVSPAQRFLENLLSEASALCRVRRQVVQLLVAVARIALPGSAQLVVLRRGHVGVKAVATPGSQGLRVPGTVVWTHARPADDALQMLVGHIHQPEGKRRCLFGVETDAPPAGVVIDADHYTVGRICRRGHARDAIAEAGQRRDGQRGFTQTAEAARANIVPDGVVRGPGHGPTVYGAQKAKLRIGCGSLAVLHG